MKRLVIFLSSTFLTTAAVAADLPGHQGPPAYISPAFTWTGFYTGVNAGYAWNGSDKLKDVGYNHPEYGPGTYANEWFKSEDKSEKDSFSGGLQVGYNYQIGSIVFGIEADLNYGGSKNKHHLNGDSDSYVDPNYEYHFRENLGVRNKIDWFGTIRPRVGFTPVDRLLVYATGGLAYGRVKNTGGYDWREYGYWWGGPGDHDFDRSGAFGGSRNQTRWGWTVGAGLEYAITNNLTVKGEYLYVDLDGKHHTVVSPEDSDEFMTWKDSARFHVVRAGLNYKF